MRHTTSTTANGLCTPPCGSSHGNLSSFRFRNSLLMLFLLLFVGTGSAWGRTPTIFGEGLPGLNICSDCGNWDSNTKVMQSMGENGYWFAEFLNVAATDNNKYRFKIAINDGDWWNGAMNSGNTNESMGNVDIVNGKGGDNQISFKMPFDGDVYIFYKSTNADNSKVWIVAVPSNIAAPPTGQSQPGYDSGRTLKTDLIFKSNRTGWGAGIKFTRSFATTYKHVTSYILPAKKNAETGNIRFQMYYGDNEYINGKSTPAQLSTSTPRRIIYMWNGDNNGSWIAYTLPTYPVRKSGWKLFVKDYNSGNPTTMDANGSATLTLNGGSSYEFFIANTDYATNISNYSSDICSTPAVHSVNCFGGCYIDESNSSNVTFSEQQVYNSSSCGTLVKSVVAAQDLRGVFQVSGSGTKDVTFTFDGGVITINAVDHGAAPEPPTPSSVTYDGSEIFYFHKKGGSLQWNDGIWADNSALYLLFSNADESNTARSTKIGYFWDVEGTNGNVLATRVPAGTWSKVKVLRTNNGDRSSIWNQSNYVDLEEGKDYLNENNAMAVYSPRTFHFYISGSTTLADTGSDFNAWNGNGTAHSGSMTKTLNAGTYKFKLNPTGTVDWRSEFNMDDVDQSNSNVTLYDDNNKEIWFDLATRSEVTIACDGSKVTVNATPSAPEPLSGDYYVFGAGGTNWVTGWSSNWNNEAYKMTIADGVATKTFYNVSGQGLEFKIHKGETQYKSDLLLAEVAYNNSHLISRVWRNGENIDFSISDINVTHKADVTVHFDGEHIWLTAVPHPETVAGSEWYIMGSGNVGTEHNLDWGKDTQKGRGNEHKMTVQDGIATITYYNVPNNSISYKVFRGSDNYEINDFYYDASASSGIICTDQDGNDNINVSLNNQNICIHWDGTKIWTTEAAAPITTYNVTFNSNGGSDIAGSPFEVEGGEKISKPADPTKAGFVFLGWKRNGSAYDFNTTVTSNFTLDAVWGIEYSGDDYQFWKSNISSWGTFLAGKDRTIFLQFKNSYTNETEHTNIAFLWEQTGSEGENVVGIVAAKAPQGQWDKVRHCRVNDDSWNENAILGTGEGSTDWFDLQPGNYIHKDNGSITFTTKTEDHFKFYLAGTVALAGGSGEFIPWKGNGTLYTDRVTKTLAAANEYKFKLNSDMSIYDNRNGVNKWSNEFNWNDIDLANSSNDISLRKNPANDNTEIWFDLSRKSDVTITCDGHQVTVNAVPYYTVTFDSNGGGDVAAQEIRNGETASDPGAPTRGSGYTFNFWKLSGESSEYDFSTPVTGDITLVADWTEPTLYTVTFDSNGGSAVVPQEVVEGQTAIAPADPTRENYTFDGWKRNDVAYNFTAPVNSDITLVASWTYAPAHISSVSINYSSIYTWQGDATTYTLVPTLVPGDIASVTVSWSSSDNNVAMVENGVITPQGEGTATITCTATDYYSHPETATCTVVVAPCAKAPAGVPSYSVTITGYDTYDGDATLDGLWDESNDNTEPASFTICNVRIGNDGTPQYAYDNNGTVMIETSSSNDVDKWYMIDAGTNLYYLKNVSTGKYMYCGPTNTSGSKGNGWTGNPDWLLRSVYTSTSNGETDSYKFYKAKDDWNNDVIVSRADASMGTKATATDFVLSRQQLTGTPGVWNDVVTNTVSASRGAEQGGNNYKGFQSAFVNEESVPNPAYIHSRMNGSYYRMNEDATVQANLGSALAEADVISVELYADAATSVTLCKTNGDVVATINLNTDATTEYTYLVTAGTMLDGENAFIIKAADNHAGIRSIAVTPMVTADPATPDLHWITTPVKEHLLLDGNFTYSAASSDSQGAISYASENTNIAQVNALTGEVTPAGAGTTTISATIAADECHAARTISYEVSFLGLQDYINTESVTNVTLPGDFTSENIVINKAITINGNNHAIGNLTVQTEGDLTLSGALTVQDFTICTNAGNSEHQAASGQVRNASYLNATGNVYFLYTVDPSGHVQYGWYDFTVPFPVDVMTGIAGIQDEVLKEDFVNERDYAIMEHLGEKQANGEYSYKKFRGIMQPNKLYSITLDNDFNYNTVRFQKTSDGDLVAGDNVTLEAHDGVATRANWNGVGNGTLHHSDANLSTADYIQIYQSGDKTFKPYNKNEISLVVGTAFMVQQPGGTMTLNQASHDELRAPARQIDDQRPAISIQIAREGKPFSDQLFITANEDAQPTYTPGVDVAKAGNIGNVSVPQIWTNAYNTKLCVHEAQLINGEAPYALSLYAPADGTYTLTGLNIPEDYTLYLTYNGRAIWNLSISETYALDLIKGINSEYGLMIVESYKTPTGMEEISSQPSVFRKILRNGILYILQNGKIYNAQGARVK